MGQMKKPRYLAFCGSAIVAGCLAGCLWFSVVLSIQSKEFGVFGLLPLLLFDSAVFGWFPALLFGASVHFVMFRFGWMKIWQWTLAGAGLAWALFAIGAWIGKLDFLSILSLGLVLLRNTSKNTWPAAICGAIVAAILRPLAIRWTNSPTTSEEIP